MKKYKVLLDLQVAMDSGYCGIGKENRMMFKVFSDIAHVDLDGLLISSNRDTVFSNYHQTPDRVETITQANQFFHEALKHAPLLKNRLLSKLKFAAALSLKKNKFSLYDIDPIFDNVIWRNVFNKSLHAEEKSIITSKKFRFTDLTKHHLSVGSYFKRNSKLNTEGYDFAIFQEPRAVSVSPGTAKIIRYHDMIPITDPDFTESMYSRGKINGLKMCAKDAFLVCISEPVRQSVIDLNPGLASKTFVVPCALSNDYKKVLDKEVLRQILVTRLSGHLVKPEQMKVLRHTIESMEDFNYIFNLATLDPKKNHVTLIRAWEKLNYQMGGKLKLIIAANPGWMTKEAEEMMRPHIELGNIIHIANLSNEEAPYVFSHAKAFVFPSYVEGFGLPPMEAMQCECPTIVSDIPTHRWVMGDASLYCNPYDVDSLAQTILQLVDSPESKSLSATLVKKGLAQVQKYSVANLTGEWSQVLAEIKR